MLLSYMHPIYTHMHTQLCTVTLLYTNDFGHISIDMLTCFCHASCFIHVRLVHVLRTARATIVRSLRARFSSSPNHSAPVALHSSLSFRALYCLNPPFTLSARCSHTLANLSYHIRVALSPSVLVIHFRCVYRCLCFIQLRTLLRTILSYVAPWFVGTALKISQRIFYEK